MSRLKSIILTCNRLNCNPSINFKTIIPFAKSTVNKNGQECAFIQSSIFIRKTQAGDTPPNSEQGRTGNRISLPTSNRKADKTTLSLLSLRLSALSASQHRPQQVGHSRSPRGLFSGETDTAQGPSCPPAAHNPKTD